MPFGGLEQPYLHDKAHYLLYALTACLLCASLKMEIIGDYLRIMLELEG